MRRRVSPPLKVAALTCAISKGTGTGHRSFCANNASASQNASNSASGRARYTSAASPAASAGAGRGELAKSPTSSASCSSQGMSRRSAIGRTTSSSRPVERAARRLQARNTFPAGPVSSPVARMRCASRSADSSSVRPSRRVAAAADLMARRCRQTPPQAGALRTRLSKEFKAAPAT